MAVSTELIITRHGEAECNITGMVGGDKTCTGLTALGHDQVTMLADRLRREHDFGRPFDALYASPRRRTRESGQLLADALSFSMIIEPELVGPEHGEADGLPWEEVKTVFAGPPQAHSDRPHTSGAETWYSYLAAFLYRAHRLDRKARWGEDSHRRTRRTIEAAHTLMLELPLNACTRLSFQTGHSSLTRWERHTNRFGRMVWMLAAHNDTAHLAP
ncbi:MAG: histidine phosphatase family protein [Pseudonocardiaceae bacterium]